MMISIIHAADIDQPAGGFPRARHRETLRENVGGLQRARNVTHDKLARRPHLMQRGDTNAMCSGETTHSGVFAGLHYRLGGAVVFPHDQLCPWDNYVPNTHGWQTDTAHSKIQSGDLCFWGGVRYTALALADDGDGERRVRPDDTVQNP